MIDLRKDFAGSININNLSSNICLYKHQEECVKALKSHNNDDKYKALLVIPTGGGKTYTSVYWILNEMINNNRKVLWIAHRHELLNQTIKTVVNTSVKNVVSKIDKFNYRVISGIHDRPVNIKSTDDLIIGSKDSLNYGDKYLSKWIEDNKDNICLVIDEAHHAVAKSYRNIIDSIENCSKNWIRIIGLTATPMRSDKNEKGLLGKIFTDGICFSVDLKNLINKGILSTPILKEFNTKMMIDSELTSKDLQNINRGLNLPDKIAEFIGKHKDRNNYIVNEYISNKSIYGKTLIFAINIDHAIALNALFKEKGIKSDFVVSTLKDAYSGSTVSNELNAKKINDFRDGTLEVLINVNILTEGTDIPNIQTVFLTRPTTSRVLMNQMIGRGLRGVNAGGTEKAYIVSFIDDWRYKINWVSPRDLEIGGEWINPQDNKGKLESKLISIKLIEEFAKMMDKTISKKFSNKDYMEIVPLGAYCFELFNEEKEAYNCEVLVFNNLKLAYEDFVINLKYIFEQKNISYDELNYNNLSNDKLKRLLTFSKNKFFLGYDLSIGFNDEDIKDILMYYAITGEAPVFIPFEGRENYDVSKLAQHIIDYNYTMKEKSDYLAKKWSDKSLGWSIYFNNDFFYFRNEIDRVIDNILFPTALGGGDANSTIEYSDLSLSQIYNIDKEYWRKLTDEVYEKYRDKDGFYESAISGYYNKNRRFFNIDHIIPMCKGGKTVLDNLQVVTRWENIKKSDKLESDVKFQAMIHWIDDDYDIDFINEKFKTFYNNDENDVDYLNLKSRLYNYEEKNRAALIFANKALKIDPNNIFAKRNRGLAYYDSGNQAKGIEILEDYIKYEERDFDILKLIGEYYYCRNKINKSLYYYHSAVDLVSYDYESNYKLAKIYERKRNYEEAIKYFDICIGLVLYEDSNLNEKGEILCKLKRYNEALECFKNAYISIKKPVYLSNAINILKNIYKKSKEEIKIFEENLNNELIIKRAALDKEYEENYYKNNSDEAQVYELDDDAIQKILLDDEEFRTFLIDE